MKRLLTLSLTLVLAFSLSACLNTRGEDAEIVVTVPETMPTEEITITFWHTYGQEKAALLDQMIADFENEAYQNHHIKYTFISKEEFAAQSRQSHNFSDIFKNAPLNMRAAIYSVGRKDGQVVATISFIVPGITESYLDQNPIVEDF